MLKKFTQFSIVLAVIFGWLFSGWPQPRQSAEAAIGDIGHWRDSLGGQIPGTTFAGFNFDQQIRNDGIFTKPTNSTIQFSEAGSYLVIATIVGVDNSNGRYNAQARVALTSGTGSLFSSYYTGYSRDNSEDHAWFRAVGVVINASANAQVQVQRRRGTDAPTSGSIPGESDVQVIRINPTNYGIYNIGGTGNAYGGTTPNTVDITSVVAESNIAAIEGNTTTETVTIKGDNKKYLLAWSVSGSGTTGSDRTQRIGHLEYSGTDNLTTRSYCYQRNATNEYCGLGSMDLIQTATADIPVKVEVFRGPGVAANQGGADLSGSLITTGNGQFVVLEMPDYLEALKSYDSIGVQDITVAATMNIARNISFNNALSFTKSSDSAVSTTNPADVFTWANVWTARNNILAGTRQSSYGSITINNVNQNLGEHGNYSRGNQGTADTFAMSYHPAGIFTVGTAGHTIGLKSTPLPSGEAGGTDRTQPNTLGFFALNLDTLVEPTFTQSGYRWFANTNTTDVGVVLAGQNTAANLTTAGQAFRLRSLINVANNQLRQNETNFKLQFAERFGTCDSAFVGETYVDVTASSLIAYNDNSTPVDGTSLTANANDPLNGLNIIVNQSYEELNNFTTNVSAIGKGQDGKWDFSLKDNGAPTSTSYCFRIVKSDGTALGTYSVIPEITTAPSLINGPAGVNTGVQLWLRADANVTTSGSAVVNWNDGSGNSKHFTTQSPVTTGKGTLTSNALNFNPVVSFNGTDGFRENLSLDIRSAYIVYKHTSTRDWETPFTSDSSIITDGLFHGDDATGDVYSDTWTPAISKGGANYVNGATTSLIAHPRPATHQLHSRLNTANSSGSGNYYLGLDRTFSDRAITGDIAELVLYSTDTAANRGKIESYLALKYGMTLGGATTDYVNSVGTSVYNYTGGYSKDVVGIAKDTTNTFDQRISKSVNSGSLLTLSTDTNFTNANTTHANTLTDGQYLVVANDGAALTEQTSELDLASYSSRIGREWRARNTGSVGAINLQFSGYDDNYILLQDADGDFSTGATNAGYLSATGAINTTLADGQYITLAETATPSSLSFSISDDAIGFGNLSSSLTKYATGDGFGSTTSAIAHAISASTNAVNGYVIELEGTEFICQSCSNSYTISSVGATPAPPSIGSEQFGINIVPTGTGSVLSPYDTANYAYNTAAMPSIVMSGVGDDTVTNFAIEYMANMNTLTPAGTYQAVLTYTMHGLF